MAYVSGEAATNAERIVLSANFFYNRCCAIIEVRKLYPRLCVRNYILCCVEACLIHSLVVRL